MDPLTLMVLAGGAIAAFVIQKKVKVERERKEDDAAETDDPSDGQTSGIVRALGVGLAVAGVTAIIDVLNPDPRFPDPGKNDRDKVRNYILAGRADTAISRKRYRRVKWFSDELTVNIMRRAGLPEGLQLGDMKRIVKNFAGDRWRKVILPAQKAESAPPPVVETA